MRHDEEGTVKQEDGQDDENDLYGDIETLARSAEAEQFKKRLLKSQQAKKSIEMELKEYKEQVRQLLVEKTQVEQNMISLYNTALGEIERKDRVISELRAEVLTLRNKPS